MTAFKPGVKIFGVRPEMLAVWPVIDSVYTSHGFPTCTITSVGDGKHGFGSFHGNGLATDFRTTRTDPDYNWADVANDIRASLTDEFDVVLEKDHIHVEFQPK